MTAPIWDMLYSNKANSLWGDSHCILYEQILPHIGSRASILDLGCGAGRNSVPFVSAGHSVLGIDNSAAAVEAFRSRIARTGLIAELLNDDVQQFHFIRSYNAILAHGILHLIELRNRQTLIAQMKAHTLRHGYNVVVVMTSKSDIPAAPAPKYYPFHPGELFDHYNDWTSSYQDSYYLEPRDQFPYRRHFDRIIARND